jgi:hypothetical protein
VFGALNGAVFTLQGLHSGIPGGYFSLVGDSKSELLDRATVRINSCEDALKTAKNVAMKSPSQKESVLEHATNTGRSLRLRSLARSSSFERDRKIPVSPTTGF